MKQIEIQNRNKRRNSKTVSKISSFHNSKDYQQHTAGARLHTQCHYNNYGLKLSLTEKLPK